MTRPRQVDISPAIDLTARPYTLRWFRFAARLLFVPSILIASPLFAQTSYTITDLGLGYGRDLNSADEIAGQLAGDVVLFGSEGTVSIPGVSGAFGTGVNDNRQAAGSLGDPSSPTQAFFINTTGAVTYYANLPGGSYTAAYGINNQGQVVGDAGVTGGGTHAFLSAPNGGALTDLGTFGGTASYGRAVNDLGEVAGYAMQTSPGTGLAYPQAFLSGVSNDLGTFGGTSSWGYGVNNLGQVTGSAFRLGATQSYQQEAFLSAPNGGPLIDLGTLGDGFYSVGFAVNNSGTVVGQSLNSSGQFAGFVYTASGGMEDLNALIPTGTGLMIDGAYGINDLGQITGGAIDSMGQNHAVLLTPIEAVPEPATWVAGALTLAILFRKRNRMA